MTKRPQYNSEQPSSNAKVHPDLSFALQVWMCVCQNTSRFPAIEAWKAAGTHDGAWHSADGMDYRKLERTVTLECGSKRTSLEIELEGFEIHESGAAKSYYKWHFKRARMLGNGRTEYWYASTEGWYRNTPQSPVLHPFDCMVYDHENANVNGVWEGILQV